MLLEQSQTWAQKALDAAAVIAPPDRTEECDTACVVALCNMGDVYRLLGDYKKSRLKYTEAQSLAKAEGFDEGLMQVQKGFEMLDKAEKGV